MPDRVAILDFRWNNFSYFWSTSHPDASYQVSSQLAFWFGRRRGKTDFHDGHHGSHLGFRIGTVLAIFDLEVTPMLPTEFQVNWPFGSGEKAKNRFSRWPPWQPYWISDQTDFSYFYLQVTLMLPTEFQVNWPFGSGEEAKSRFARWPPRRPFWILDRNNFSYFWSTSHPHASYQV